MIKSFRHKGLERFFLTGSKAGIQPNHVAKLTDLLTLLNSIKKPELMAVPGWEWHALKGDSIGSWAISVNGNWRIVYGFEGEDAVLVDYRDYH